MSASVIYLTKAISIVVLIFDASIRFPGVKEIESVRQGYGERNYRYRRQAAIQRGWTGRQYGCLQIYQVNVESKRPR